MLNSTLSINLDGIITSVVTTSSPVPQVKVKSMAIMMIQGQVEGTPVD
jgi:hypothetical protein